MNKVDQRNERYQCKYNQLLELVQKIGLKEIK